MESLNKFHYDVTEAGGLQTGFVKINFWSASLRSNFEFPRPDFWTESLEPNWRIAND